MRSNVFTSKNEQLKILKFNITKNINLKNIEPVHLVLFACFIEYLGRLNYLIFANIEDEELSTFIFSDLNLASYFSNDKSTNHFDSPRREILNLWKIIEGGEKGYSISVTEYFKRNYFDGCDLTIFQSSLDEVYLNVADHANASGNAFSYIKYSEKDRSIHVALCDFGLGIPTTLKNSHPGKYKNDVDALIDSLEIGVSAHTNSHNRGFGLDNVVSNLMNNDRIRIVSNKALLFCFPDKNPIRIIDLDFDFKGTLIYFDICIDAFQSDEEILSDVTIG